MKKNAFFIFFLFILPSCKMNFVTDELLEKNRDKYQVSFFVKENDSLFNILSDEGYYERDTTGINIYADGARLHIADSILHEGIYVLSNPLIQGQLNEGVSYIEFSDPQIDGGPYFSADSTGYIHILRIVREDGKHYILGSFETVLDADTLSLALIDGHFKIRYYY